LWLRMMEAWAFGCCGQVDESRAVAAAMSERMPPRGFELIKWYLAHLHIQFALQAGDIEGAWRAVLSARKATRFSLTSQPQRIFGLWLSAAAALARATTADRKAMLAEVRRICSRLEREGAPWAIGIARGLSAGVASILGERELALNLYAEAETLFETHHLELA